MRSFEQHFGDVVIDYLTLTFQTNQMFMSSLSAYSEEVEILGYRFVPTREYSFEFAFKIYLQSEEIPIGSIKFNNPSHKWDNYIHIQYCNHIFYDRHKLQHVLQIGYALGLTFLCVARIDLAIDLPKNIMSIIRKTMRSETAVPVINNKCCWDRKATIKNCFVVGDITRDRVKINSFYAHNANKNLCVKSYDKLNEIKKVRREGDDDYKQYIIDYYGGKVKSLHRLEVSAIGKYLYDFPLALTPENILDQEFLQVLYYEFLGRVISFSTVGVCGGHYRSRTPITWSSLLGLPSNNNNITSYANIYNKKEKYEIDAWNNVDDCCDWFEQDTSITKTQDIDQEKSDEGDSLNEAIFYGANKILENRNNKQNNIHLEAIVNEQNSGIKSTKTTKKHGFSDEEIDAILNTA